MVGILLFYLVPLQIIEPSSEKRLPVGVDNFYLSEIYFFVKRVRYSFGSLPLQMDWLAHKGVTSMR
jgi:hypothetical protein